MRSKDRGLMDRMKSYVEEYALTHHGDTPTMRDIGAAFGINHSTAYRYLRSMDELGMIRYDHGSVSTDLIDKIDVNPRLSRSYVDAIPAGPADELEGAVDEYVSIPSSFLNGKNGNFFTLVVNGDSMTDAGIDSGDIVICKEVIEAREGDIVVALVDGKANTLKRVRCDDDGLYLWAENESWSDEDRMYGRNFTIQGVAFKVVKDI